MLYSYGACIFTVIYLPARLHLPITKCSDLVNVELKKKICEQSERKNFYGLTNPKMLPPPLYKQTRLALAVVSVGSE